MGGKVAMKVADLNRESIRHLIIVDIAPIAYVGDHLKILEGLYSLRKIKAQSLGEISTHLKQYIDDDHLIAFLLKNFKRREGGLELILNIESIQRNYTNILEKPNIQKENTVPTTVIGGDQSTYLSKDAILALESHYSNVTIKMIKDANHWVHASQPNLFLSVLHDCLNE